MRFRDSLSHVISDLNSGLNPVAIWRELGVAFWSDGSGCSSKSLTHHSSDEMN